MEKKSDIEIVRGQRQNSFKIFHINIQSLTNKILEIQVLLSKIKPDLLLISEHWMRDDGMNSVHHSGHYGRSCHRGGGIAIFVREIFPARVSDRKQVP